MNEDSYRLLAQRLDALPNGFPPAPDGAELRLLAKLFAPEEAALAAALRLTLETPAEIAGRIGGDPAARRSQLKSLARRGLIAAGRAAGGVGYGLMPFVVGFYEMQASTMDAELAQLFEDYYRQTHGQALLSAPPVHRVIPVEQTVRVDMEVRPYESAVEIVAANQAWGVTDCICRKQRALIGEACGHPLDVCMTFSPTPGAFDHVPGVRTVTQAEALATLRRAADAGLVHSVSNNQEGLWYICNCCTCSCGILRGMADLGIADVIARSAFVNQADAAVCGACGLCVEHCQFGALAVHGVIQVDGTRCVGCGVCVPVCPDGALGLVRRPAAEIQPTPATEAAWRAARAAARGLDLSGVL